MEAARVGASLCDGFAFVRYIELVQIDIKGMTKLDIFICREVGLTS